MNANKQYEMAQAFLQIMSGISSVAVKKVTELLQSTFPFAVPPMYQETRIEFDREHHLHEGREISIMKLVNHDDLSICYGICVGFENFLYFYIADQRGASLHRSYLDDHEEQNMILSRHNLYHSTTRFKAFVERGKGEIE